LQLADVLSMPGSFFDPAGLIDRSPEVLFQTKSAAPQVQSAVRFRTPISGPRVVISEMSANRKGQQGANKDISGHCDYGQWKN
jgi:hypothetical protein